MRDNCRDILDIHIGKRLKQRRLELGFSQAELGRFLDLSPWQIREYENGLRSLSAGILYRTSLKLQVEYSYFFPTSEHEVIYNCDSSQVTDKEIGKLLKIFRKIDDSEARSLLLNIAREIRKFTKNHISYRLDSASSGSFDQ